jgi:nucleotide-binding universal stress UspA family protein
MKKILVTTDLSTSSKAALRFAFQLASQGKFELVFFHCFQAMIPTTIHRAHIEDALREQVQDQLKSLERFVAATHRSIKTGPGNYRCVVVEDLSPEKAILEQAQREQADYICISTRGAGQVLKLIGTHTSRIIVHSSIPVLVVPHTYRTRALKKIMYASDLENMDREMPKVSDFAQATSAKIDLAHFFYNASILAEAASMQAMWRKKYKALDQVILRQMDLDATFAAQFEVVVKKEKPGIAAFFTHTNQTWYAKLFSANRAEAYSFVTKVPMLVFRKV